jgi:hypothetical protein
MSAFEDEKLFLASAFADQIKWIDDWHCIVNLSSFELVLDFPLEYPDSPPFVSFHAMPGRKLPADLETCLLDLFIPGQVVVFEWIQYLSDLKIEECSVSAANEPATEANAPSATATRSTGGPCITAGESFEEDFDQNSLPPGCPTIYHSSNPFINKKSVFIAHCAQVMSQQEINIVELFLKSDKKISKATHNITAYRFLDSGEKVREEYQDDGETMAGKRLLHMLQSADCHNVYVMVSRWYIVL